MESAAHRTPLLSGQWNILLKIKYSYYLDRKINQADSVNTVNLTLARVRLTSASCPRALLESCGEARFFYIESGRVFRE